MPGKSPTATLAPSSNHANSRTLTHFRRSVSLVSISAGTIPMSPFVHLHCWLAWTSAWSSPHRFDPRCRSVGRGAARRLCCWAAASPEPREGLRNARSKADVSGATKAHYHRTSGWGSWRLWGRLGTNSSYENIEVTENEKDNIFLENSVYVELLHVCDVHAFQVSGCGRPTSHRHCPPFPSPWQPFWPQPLGLSSGRRYPRHQGLRSSFLGSEASEKNLWNEEKHTTMSNKNGKHGRFWMTRRMFVDIFFPTLNWPRSGRSCFIKVGVLEAAQTAEPILHILPHVSKHLAFHLLLKGPTATQSLRHPVLNKVFPLHLTIEFDVGGVHKERSAHLQSHRG